VTTIDILLSHKEGPAPDYVKLVMVNPRTNTDGDLIVFEDPYEGTGAGPLHGHANAAGATAVGAAWWFNTPEFGVAPPLLEFFSSAGNTNIYYNVEGNPITPPEERSKPEITAPDRGATSLFPHFIGTSGAAPHAAAVAALMLEANPTLAPAEIKAALQSSAVDILERVAFDEVTKTATGSGTDADSGAGLIDAYAAVEAVTTPPTGGPGPKLHVGTVTDVGSSGWKTVNLPVSYTSMVVVASINYANSSVPAIVRIRDAVGSSFDVRVDNPSGTPVTGVTVHYLVAEEGAYTEADDGITMEAVKFTSTVTDRKNGWTGEDRGYANSYTTPVVLGQVMSYNDPGWSVFWAQGSSRTSPPSASALKVGKHVGEDTDVTRADEQIGYIVFESGNGSLGEIDYATAVGADSVKGITNSPPFSYSGTFPATPTAALVSTAGMDGGDGGWPILYGTSPITSSTLNLAFDEDQVGDTERNHTSEQAAYIVFGAQGENQAPTASFTSSASGLTVNFTDTSEDSDGSIVSWAWSFGDESTSTDQNPSHTYASTGTYTVTLTVTDDDGDSDSSSQPVSVTAPEEPIVVFYDGFENGAWDGLWTEDSQDDWFTSTQRSTSGSYSAEVDGSANNAELVSIPINLQGRTSATIGFDWYIEKGLDSGEYLAFDVSTDDGATWVEKAKLAGNVDQENTWHQIQIELNGIAALQMRFRGKMSRGNEDADVDEVSVTAQ
jgi:PKD repeat protein